MEWRGEVWRRRRWSEAGGEINMLARRSFPFAVSCWLLSRCVMARRRLSRRRVLKSRGGSRRRGVRRSLRRGGG